MALPVSFLTPGRTVRVRSDGEVLSGTVTSCANGWLRLAASGGDLLINLATISWVAGDGGAAEEELPQPQAVEVVRGGSKVPARPWSDAAVQAIVSGFLEDRGDAELASEHGRTRNQVTILRQAWECARGNITDDRLSPAAQLWVERIRRAMRPG